MAQTWPPSPTRRSVSTPVTDAAAAPRFVFHPTSIAGVVEVELGPVGDHRGTFARLFDAEEFAAIGLFPDGAVQTNLAVTAVAGTVRGLHWQEPVDDRTGEAKLILCVAGRVFDVAVDLRPSSPTRLQHHSVELVAGTWRALLIPPGVAHGMQALEDGSMLLYHHAAPFDATLERGVRVDDPALAIPWPLPVRDLSDRDRAHGLLGPDNEEGRG
jgi:dTDP-4-dehydrorhamnose 3,5-epimerase